MQEETWDGQSRASAVESCRQQQEGRGRTGERARVLMYESGPASPRAVDATERAEMGRVAGQTPRRAAVDRHATDEAQECTFTPARQV